MKAKITDGEQVDRYVREIARLKKMNKNTN